MESTKQERGHYNLVIGKDMEQFKIFSQIFLNAVKLLFCFICGT